MSPVASSTSLSQVTFTTGCGGDVTSRGILPPKIIVAVFVPGRDVNCEINIEFAY